MATLKADHIYLKMLWSKMATLKADHISLKMLWSLWQHWKQIIYILRCYEVKWQHWKQIIYLLRCYKVKWQHWKQIIYLLRCYEVKCRGRNKPKLPLVRRISDMLQTTCPPTCPLVQVLVHFVGPKLDALDRQNSSQCKGWHGSHWHRHSFVVISCLKCLNWIFSTQVTCWSLRNYLQYNLVMDR